MSPTARFVTAYAGYVAAIHAIPQLFRWPKGAVVDRWTVTHLVWGAIGQRMGVSLGTVTALSAANEVGEALVRHFRPDLVFGSPETPANITVDVLANIAGWLASSHLRNRKHPRPATR